MKYLSLFKRILSISLAKKLGFFQMPYKYIFILTNKCNSECKTCKIWKIYNQNPEKLGEELSLREYEKIFEGIKDEVTWLNFSGGEPFLREDIVKISNLAFNKFENLSIFNIPTNGIRTGLIKEKTERILDEIPDSVEFYITVSLDGPKEIHNKIKGVKGYENAWKTYEELLKLKSNHPNFHVGPQMTFSKYNLGEFDFAKKIIEETEMPIFTFAHEAKYFNNLGEKVDLRKSKSDKVEKTIDFIQGNYEVGNLKELIPKLYLKLADEFYKNPEKMILPCMASYATITVDPYGNVKPCSYFSTSIGNLKENDYDLRDIIDSKGMEKARKKIEQEECVGCWTNCEAYPTIFHHFPLAILKSLK